MGIEINLFFCGWSKLTLFQCGRSKLTWLQCRDRNKLVFFVGVENDLDVVWDFMCTGRKLLGVGIESDLIFVRVIRIDLISGDRNWLDFRVGMGIDLISVLGSKLTSFLCGSKLTWFKCWDRNWLGFVRGSKLTSFMCAGRNDLILVHASNLTWFLCGDQNYLVFVCEPKWLVFREGVDLLVFMCVVGIDLVVSGYRTWLSFRVFHIALARGVQLHHLARGVQLHPLARGVQLH